MVTLVERLDNLDPEEKDLALRQLVHDLRAPLRTIVGFSELLVEDNPGLPPEVSEWANHLKNGAEKLSGFLTELYTTPFSEVRDNLVIAHNAVLTAPPTSLESAHNDDLDFVLSGQRIYAQLAAYTLNVGEMPREFNFSTHLRLFCSMYLNILQQKGIEFVDGTYSYELVTSVPYMRCIDNLLGNAITHSGATRITAGLMEQKSGSYFFYVEDNGIGIPEQNLEQIFQPGFSTSTPNGDSQIVWGNGSGQGLAIVKSEVEMYGGTIQVESPIKQKQSGTRFYFTIPLDKIIS